MTDTAEAVRDDGPLAASKHTSAAVDAATDALVEGKGDAIVGRSVTINKPVVEVYAAFRDFAGWPRFMDNVERIDVLDDKRSHWVVKAPAGQTVEWDARVTEEEPGRLIAWTSEEGASVANSGRITFRDAGERGTVVDATILYDPPAGIVGQVVAKLFQREPKLQARRDLRRFKQFLETGEVATGARTRADLQHRKG